MQGEIDEICMCVKFGGCNFIGFGDFSPFQIWPNFPLRPWTIVHGGQQIERLKKFKQVEANVKWCGFSGFGDFAPFQIWPNFSFRPLGSKIRICFKNLYK